ITHPGHERVCGTVRVGTSGHRLGKERAHPGRNRYLTLQKVTIFPDEWLCSFVGEGSRRRFDRISRSLYTALLSHLSRIFSEKECLDVLRGMKHADDLNPVISCSIKYEVLFKSTVGPHAKTRKLRVAIITDHG